MLRRCISLPRAIGQLQLQRTIGMSVRGISDGKPSSSKYDVVIVGGGHNGLTAAAYLARGGKSVAVLERRHLLGGAAVTEEIVPGFRFSRASYVYSLFRPDIVEELDLKRHGLHVFPRNPASFTPLKDGRSLLLGSDMESNLKQIAQFSEQDAAAYVRYNDTLEKCVDFFVSLLDSPPPDPKLLFSPSVSTAERINNLRSFMKLGSGIWKLGKNIPEFLEFMTAPATKVLNRWFESEPLRATLATDAIIGAWVAPSTPSSAYVLFHHVMGEIDGVKGVWGYVRGGMGGVSNAIANAAEEAGAELVVNTPVKAINYNEGLNSVDGVTLEDGSIVKADVVLSSAAPAVTFGQMLPPNALPQDLKSSIDAFDANSGSVKINIAVNKLPNFACRPNTPDNKPLPHHRGTIHFEEHISQIEEAFSDAQSGHPSKKPIIEMTIPSSLDPTLTDDPNHHVVLLFVQYAPYTLKEGNWMDDATRENFANRVFEVIEEYAPGFKESIVGYDMLTPPDLERVFALPRGNIFHGAMGLDQLFWLRPAAGMSRYATPISNLYLTGAGTHPGGGVMGSPGRNAARVVLGKP